MRRWLVFFYSFLSILVFLSIILFVINIYNTKKEDKINKDKEKQEWSEKYTIDYKANQTVRVKISKTGEVIAMDINDYLRGVVPAEMPPYYNIEAIKAQATVARTYTYKRIEACAEGEEADICDNFAHCQAFYSKEQIMKIWESKGYDENTRLKYWENINEAVVSTQDEVILYNGQLIKAFFHASSPYKTESVDQIWGGEMLPYLVSVENKEAEDYANRTSNQEVSFHDFVTKIKEDDQSKESLSEDDCKDIQILNYTTSGRVKDIKVGEFLVSAEKLRTLFSLRSTLFTIDIHDDKIVFNVIGNGHGIGMSQVGADYLASNENMSYVDIIKHYYTGVDVVKLE